MTTATTADSQVQARDAVAGILWMVLAVFIFIGMDALAKWQAERYHVAQLVFFRSTFGLFVVLPFLLHGTGLRAKLKSRRLGLHFVRAAVGTISLFAFFLAYQKLALADVIALSFISPLLMTALSVPLLGETVGWRRWTAIGVGFLGVLVMVQPGGGLFSAYALLPLAGAFTYALVGVTIRVLSRTEEPATIVFFFGLFSSVTACLFLPFVWVTPADLTDWAGQIGIGLIGGLAQLAMTTAFRRAPVSVVSPFEYTGIVWGVAIGFAFWGELPSLAVWAGCGLVVGSGLYILHREASLARRG
ncbi:DMT family transporter [Zavarzinia compransoris]|uniref:EamA/RhaT family transporter n=1 Tax=Zavarzinia compransoris TaxID=1264899 RepID=A0A317EBV0_9PROT|nr:DMT family transporter [Zavarzinia compransoris]PWR23590.1 EamA/RhaT family transporter [Zavarzinia compransoris]TDP47807.1 EamA domain-containing membrane protein RarD [Zavarzinia compransoris]